MTGSQPLSEYPSNGSSQLSSSPLTEFADLRDGLEEAANEESATQKAVRQYQGKFASFASLLFLELCSPPLGLSGVCLAAVNRPPSRESTRHPILSAPADLLSISTSQRA